MEQNEILEETRRTNELLRGQLLWTRDVYKRQQRDNGRAVLHRSGHVKALSAAIVKVKAGVLHGCLLYTSDVYKRQFLAFAGDSTITSFDIVLPSFSGIWPSPADSRGDVYKRQSQGCWPAPRPRANGR